MLEIENHTTSNSGVVFSLDAAARAQYKVIVDTALTDELGLVPTDDTELTVRFVSKSLVSPMSKTRSFPYEQFGQYSVGNKIYTDGTAEPFAEILIRLPKLIEAGKVGLRICNFQFYDCSQVDANVSETLLHEIGHHIYTGTQSKVTTLAKRYQAYPSSRQGALQQRIDRYEEEKKVRDKTRKLILARPALLKMVQVVESEN